MQYKIAIVGFCLLLVLPDPAQNDRQIRRNLTDQSGSI
jgi:hypothetical protein